MTRSSSKKPLYIFLHIPKCAGSTVRFHIEHTLEPGEYISIYDGYYLDVRNRRRTYFTLGNRDLEIDSYLSRLTEEEKGNIKVLYGHRVYYGIHRFFRGREPRYVTLVRDPIARTVSHYNASRDHLECPEKHPAETGNAYYAKEFREVCQGMMENGHIVPLPEWLRRNAWLSDFMTSTLAEQRFVHVTAAPKNILQDFFFVGLTEQNADVLYLLSLFGVRRAYPNQNVSSHYVSVRALPNAVKKVLGRHTARDQMFYEAARRARRSPRGMSRLARAIVRTRYYRMLRPLYEASAQLRRKSELYGRSLDSVKRNVTALLGSPPVLWKE